MGDEVREKVGQNPEQRQATNAVAGQNPRSAAFMLPGSGSRGLLSRRDDRGPIFHAKPPDGKIVAQHVMRHACLALRAGQDYRDTILSRFAAVAREKCDYNHNTIKIIDFHSMTIRALGVHRFAASIALSLRACAVSIREVPAFVASSCNLLTLRPQYLPHGDMG